LNDDLYVQLIGSEDDDTVTVRVATTSRGTVDSHIFRGMSRSELDALLHDLGATLARGESSISDTLAAWAAVEG
jgi:hypothetical protein